MISVVQHDTKTCVICTGVVWLVLPAAIELNYHLASMDLIHYSYVLLILFRLPYTLDLLRTNYQLQMALGCTVVFLSVICCIYEDDN